MNIVVCLSCLQVAWRARPCLSWTVSTCRSTRRRASVTTTGWRSLTRCSPNSHLSQTECAHACVTSTLRTRIIMNKICSISVCCCDCGTIVAVSYNSNDCSAKCCTYCRLLNKRWIENWRVSMQHCSDVMIRVCRFILLVTRLKKDRLHFVLLMTPASGHKNQTPNVKDLHTTLFSRSFWLKITSV